MAVEFERVDNATYGTFHYAVLIDGICEGYLKPISTKGWCFLDSPEFEYLTTQDSKAISDKLEELEREEEQ